MSTPEFWPTVSLLNLIIYYGPLLVQVKENFLQLKLLSLLVLYNLNLWLVLTTDSVYETSLTTSRDIGLEKPYRIFLSYCIWDFTKRSDPVELFVNPS